MAPPDDRHVVGLVRTDKRLNIYWELNQCSSPACCPAAAAAMWTYLETGNCVTIPINQCANPGQGYDISPPVGSWTGPVDIARLVRAVAGGDPGNHVVVGARRPDRNRCGLATEHYFNLAKIGPGCTLQDDFGHEVGGQVVWVDASASTQDIWCVGLTQIRHFAFDINCMNNSFRYTRERVTATLVP
jgi:hypothetical protein